MSLKYFSGIEFLSWGGSDKSTLWTTRNIKDYYTLQFAYSGRMYLALDDDSNLKKYEAPFVWLMYKDRYFRYGSPDGIPWGHYYVAFKGPRVRKFISGGLYPLNENLPVFPISEPDLFLASMKELFASLEESPRREADAVHILEGLLLSMRREKIKKQDSIHMPALRKLAASIRTTPAKKRDFKKEAASLNLSYVHFRTLFREATGFPPKQFLLKCRVSTARHLLKNSRDSLEEIAETVGIDNVYYFSRLFKKHFHIPPGRYRKEFL